MASLPLSLEWDVMRGEKYLTKPQQYAFVYGNGSSWTSRLIVMKVLNNGLSLSRYGFSVSKRVGTAVTRNKVKRRLRELLRIIPVKPGWDIVFIVRPAAATASFAALKGTVQDLLFQAGLLSASGEILKNSN